MSGPPRGRLTFDLATGHRIIDPEGGQPIEVSSRLQPDPLAICMLACSIIEATRAIERNALSRDRHTRWVRILSCILGVLVLVGLVGVGNAVRPLVYYILQWLSA